MKPTFKLYDHDYAVDDMFDDEDLTDAMSQVIDAAAFCWAGDSKQPHITFTCDEGTVIMMRNGELYGTDADAVEAFHNWMADAFDYAEEN